MKTSPPPKRSRLRSIMRGLTLTVLALLALLAVAGLVYQGVSASRDMSRYPPPGRIIAVDGLQLHCMDSGGGPPTVVFDSPAGMSSLGWTLVEPEVAKFSHTFSWDRPGLGWSDLAPRPQTSGNLVELLHELLEESGVPKPYVLVGSSFGASNLRLFAFRYPDEVAGLVLVDPAHEDQFEVTPAPPRPSMWPLRLYQIASRIGVMRLTNMPVGIAGMNVLPPDRQEAATAIGLRTDAVDAIVAEIASVEQSFEEVRQARMEAGRQPLGDRPLVVLTRQEAAPPTGDEAALYDGWVKLHEQLATESSRGRQVFVPESGHFIAVDQPAKVVDAIREIVDAVRDSPTGS